MTQDLPTIFIGNSIFHQVDHEVNGEYISILDDTFYKIKNFDSLPPFFMSIVSSSNHWLFISSTGGLTAGRVSAEKSLFPYFTDDKLSENHEHTGSKTILLITRGDRTSLWEPFSDRFRNNYRIERNLYKNVIGTAILFEEVNHSLGVTFRYAWRTSDCFGFVKTSWLLNFGEYECQAALLDGIQNILPANVPSSTLNTMSNLLDAYKRSEVNQQSGLAIFALNSTLTDLAEPSESLLASAVFQLGLEHPDYFLSSQVLNRFRAGLDMAKESEVRGQRGAYFVNTIVKLEPGTERSWHFVADVYQDSTAIVRLSNRLVLRPSEMIDSLERDIKLNDANLRKIVASADGIQVSNDQLSTAHHFANVMFNVMRGGIFMDQYTLQKKDFVEFVQIRSHAVIQAHEDFLSALPASLEIRKLLSLAEASGSQNLIRLSYTYLPLSFSRRHGDPSRPWNRFAIDIKKQDGSLKLGYEGNWRDIFQNWEALALSYPDFVDGMICTFLNATTADGYNPYRITHKGIDWEFPEPNNPWANIGYWSDHQIIYLQKLMEISTRLHPGQLTKFLSQPIFSYASVPYQIKPYADLLEDPYNSIDFNWDLQKEIELRVQANGSDGKLACDQNGQVRHAALAEKLLTLLLAKIVNFVPEGGIWMNTQRPEWNDANNALVGKGLSVVTLCYLRRFIASFKDLLGQSDLETVDLDANVQGLYLQLFQVLKESQEGLQGSFNDQQRRSMMDALGQAGSAYRTNYYRHGFAGVNTHEPVSGLLEFLDLALQYVEHSLIANKRSDNLYHTYNILHLSDSSAAVGHLYEMLEGQVAILSSGLLSGEESLALLESLRHSQLYRPDQHSYILYPDRELPGFLEKNRMTLEQLQGLALLQELANSNDKTLIVRDESGNYHFNGAIRNAKDVARLLDALKEQPQFTQLVKTDYEKVLALFEKIFKHSEFTGRSGTFFAYEGLGSIYWHMISKLLLAVQETIFCTRSSAVTEQLIEKYADIRRGLSFNKPPDEYGAFPTDPYSHTPKNQGAKQPGMTGLVKEEILTRQAELGYFVENGKLKFDFLLLDHKEFLTGPAQFSYWDIEGQPQQIDLQTNTIAYSICQVPVVLQVSVSDSILVHFNGGGIQQIDGHELDSVNSNHIFQRNGKIHHLVVSIMSFDKPNLP